jgi:hypothetical protein
MEPSSSTYQVNKASRSAVANFASFLSGYSLTTRSLLLSLPLQDTKGSKADNILYYRQHSPLQSLSRRLWSIPRRPYLPLCQSAT